MVMFWRKPDQLLPQGLHRNDNTQISFFLFKTFLVIGSLQGPRGRAGQFYSTILTDKNIHRSDISYFSSSRVELLCSSQQCQCQVPQLIFLEEFFIQALAVMYLVTEDKGIIFEDELL